MERPCNLDSLLLFSLSSFFMPSGLCNRTSVESEVIALESEVIACFFHLAPSHIDFFFVVWNNGKLVLYTVYIITFIVGPLKLWELFYLTSTRPAIGQFRENIGNECSYNENVEMDERQYSKYG